MSGRTAPSQEGRLSSVEDLDIVVDCDGHMMEELTDFAPYIENEAIERRINQSIQRWVYARSVPSPIKGEAFTDRRGDANASIEATRGDMDKFGITHTILSPGLNLSINSIDNTRVQVAIAKAYNAWVVDNFVDEGERIKPAIVVPSSMPDKAAEEIDRYADEDISGVLISLGGLVPPLGNHRYTPIYEAAESHGLPMQFHSGSSTSLHNRPVMRKWTETYTENHAVSHPFEHMWNLTTLIMQGVPARFPDLNFVFQEAGIGWIPYMRWRLDDHYLDGEDETPYLEKLPSEYIDDQIYFTTQPLGHTAENPTHLAQAIDMAGPGNIMYSADLPHRDFDPPEELFERIKTYFDDDVVRGIMGETAAELYDLR